MKRVDEGQEKKEGPVFDEDGEGTTPTYAYDTGEEYAAFNDNDDDDNNEIDYEEEEYDDDNTNEEDIADDNDTQNEPNQDQEDSQSWDSRSARLIARAKSDALAKGESYPPQGTHKIRPGKYDTYMSSTPSPRTRRTQRTRSPQGSPDDSTLKRTGKAPKRPTTQETSAKALDFEGMQDHTANNIPEAPNPDAKPPNQQ